LIPVINVKYVVDRAARICIAMRNRTREREREREEETAVLAK